MVAAKTAPERVKFKAWITKFALTSGIMLHEVEDCGDIRAGMVSETRPRGRSYHRMQWHREREAAILHAKRMRDAKIASLEKKIARLRALEFK